MFRVCPALKVASLACLLALSLSAEVIYDNTRFILSGYAIEEREYGDQIDLEGTARNLTELTIYYYADVVPDGDETVKVRIYRNEVPYDLYRHAPQTLLYESGNLPYNSGYNTVSISNLNVQLPFDTATVTVEFKGFKTNEAAGLLFYSPPTVGWSFNEFWGRTLNGSWAPFLYSTTDFTKRANAGIKLVAQPQSVLAEQQTRGEETLALRDGTNELMFAQTFTPQMSGRLDRVEVPLEWTGAPVQLSISDAEGGDPGTNSFGTQVVPAANGGKAIAAFYDQSIYLAAGKQYAIQLQTQNPQTDSPQYQLQHSNGDSYPGGALWMRKVSETQWQLATNNAGLTNLDAAFSVSIVPGTPAVRFTTPTVGQSIPFGSQVRLAAELNLPPVSQLYRVRFFEESQEILPQVFKAPFEVLWHATNTGPRTLRVVVEDTFGRPFRAENRVVTVQEPPPLVIERIAHIEQGTNGVMLLRFPTLTNETVRIEYSADLQTWKTAEGSSETSGEVGGGEPLTLLFTDDGPPKTESHPKDTRQRFYRFVIGG